MIKNKLNNIIIGKGYLGKYFKKNLKIKNTYNSKNIKQISNKKFNTVYLVAPSSSKFQANAQKTKDSQNLKSLISILMTIKCRKIICISTVDVFNDKNSNEKSKIERHKLSPYGFNRLKLINFIKKKFKNYLIIKLPSLFGSDEKKGFFFDLINSNNIKFYNKKTKLQWYYTPKLLEDIQKISKLNINDINLLSEPISCGQLSKNLYLKKSFNNSTKILSYNIKSIHNYRNKRYSYKKNEIISYMKNYLKIKY